jgi:hypothetical protein
MCEQVCRITWRPVVAASHWMRRFSIDHWGFAARRPTSARKIGAPGDLTSKFRVAIVSGCRTVSGYITGLRGHRSRGAGGRFTTDYL